MKLTSPLNVFTKVGTYPSPLYSLLRSLKVWEIFNDISSILRILNGKFLNFKVEYQLRQKGFFGSSCIPSTLIALFAKNVYMFLGGIRKQTQCCSEAGPSIDTGRVVHVLWRTIIWPLDVSRELFMDWQSFSRHTVSRLLALH